MMKAHKFSNRKNDTHYNRIIIEDLALFVFIPNVTNLEDSFNEFAKLRARPNDEFWLVDVSVWLKPKDAAKVKFFYTDVSNKKQDIHISTLYSSRKNNKEFSLLF